MKRLMETGEEHLGKFAQQLLSNERFVSTVQTLVSRTLAAKGTLDKSLRSALSAMNFPTTQEVEALRAKVADLEALVTRLEAKLGQQAKTDEP
ncbi:MAG: hypothetical protein ACKVPX_05800 [Myxococcaceae bacterium]